MRYSYDTDGWGLTFWHLHLGPVGEPHDLAKEMCAQW